MDPSLAILGHHNSWQVFLCCFVVLFVSLMLVLHWVSLETKLVTRSMNITNNIVHCNCWRALFFPYKYSWAIWYILRVVSVAIVYPWIWVHTKLLSLFYFSPNLTFFLFSGFKMLVSIWEYEEIFGRGVKRMITLLQWVRVLYL